MQKIWNGRGGTQCEYIIDMMEVSTVVQISYSPFGPKPWALCTNRIVQDALLGIIMSRLDLNMFFNCSRQRFL